MPRIRYIKPEFFSDEDLAELPIEARMTFAGLWCYADKSGRLQDRPRFLKAMIFPYDNIDVEKQLSMLSKPKRGNFLPFIQRYTAGELHLIQILQWEKHQRPHHTEKDSTFPPAPPLKEKGMGMGMEKQLEASTELGDGELTVEEPLDDALEPSKIETTFKKLSDEEWMEQTKINYPWIDLDAELRKMNGFLSTHPGRKRTRLFIIRWLNRIDKPMDLKEERPILEEKPKDVMPPALRQMLHEATEKGWKV